MRRLRFPGASLIQGLFAAGLHAVDARPHTTCLYAACLLTGSLRSVYLFTAVLLVAGGPVFCNPPGLPDRSVHAQVRSSDPGSLLRLAEERPRGLDSSLNRELDEPALRTDPVAVRSYHADITIHPEGYFDVREQYEVQFNQPRHGIYRTIPLRVRLAKDPAGARDPSTPGDFIRSMIFPPAGMREIAIDKVEVPGHPVEVNKQPFSPDGLSIRIGSPDKYVEGIRHYTIQYRVKDAFLFEDSVTYFYWNLLGSNWEFPFYKAGFSVHLPGAPEARGFVYTGFKGDTSSNAVYSYKNGVFSGMARETLGSGKDMTLLLHLPPGYIRRPAAFSIWYKHYGWTLFCLGAMVLFFLAWYRWGRDSKPVETVEYFPPAGMDPAMAGFLADERAHNRDLTALIPYWGAKGLISMREEDPKSKGILTIKRGQRAKLVIGILFLLIFLGMFFGGWKTFVFSSGAGAGSLLGMLVPVLFIAFPFIFMACRALYKSAGKNELSLHKKGELPTDAPLHERTMFSGLFRTGDTVHISALKNTFYTTLNEAKAALGKHCRGLYFTRHSRRNVVITAVLCVFAAFTGGIWLGFAFNFIGGVLFFLTCIGLSFYSGAMTRRVVQGDQALRQVEGFRLFIRKARKRELELLVKDNPGYFEDTLAYALAFGLAEKYSGKFDGLISEPPEWYSGNGSHFTVSGFSRSFNSTMASTAETLVSSPSSSGGGGSSSGGGSSGGGFGGGGGGSW